jgi:SAM-dependent methyltransferase
MSLRVWDERVLPRLTDRSLRGPELDELRRAVCAGLSGRVLEIGFGSGLNIPWYPGGVTSVAAIEPSDLAWELAEAQRSASEVPVEREGLDAQLLDLPDDSFDSALVTFSLCTVPDPLLALREARRVVRAGGRLHALEHGIAPEASVRRWQHRMEPVQRRVFAGCHLTHDVPALLASAGWRVEDREQDYLPGPVLSRPWTYVYRLVAG